MDLSGVQENLAKENYSDPTEFAKDMRLIFSNSKTFNTNKRSRVSHVTVTIYVKFLCIVES